VGVLARGRLRDGGRSAEWLFTDRRGGASEGPYAALNLGASVGDVDEAVAANRRAVASLLGADRLALVRQVHGRDVAVLEEPVDVPPDADAIVTAAVDVPVAVQVADCVPILLADLRGGRVAAVHAGWRGLVADVVSATLDVLGPQGPVNAWVGPAICPACYEVGPEVLEEVMRVVPEAAALTREGTPAVDVRAGVVAQLAGRGISAELVGNCTYEDPHLYSYRRDGVTGRQVGVIVLREAATP
jgi:YfiH family protein